MKKSAAAAILIMIPFTLALMSCKAKTIPSSKVSQDKLLRYYHAMSTNKATTYVKAYFYTEAGFDTQNNVFGKAVELDKSAKITFNGKPMELTKGFWSGVYYGIKSEKWPETFTFEFTDNEGKKHVDEFSMDIIDLKHDLFLKVGTDYTVEWEGSPVKEGEVVSVSIGEGDDVQYFSTDEVGAKKISVEDLPVGFDPVKFHGIELERKFSKRDDDSDFSDDIENGVYVRLIYTIEK